MSCVDIGKVKKGSKLVSKKVGERKQGNKPVENNMSRTKKGKEYTYPTDRAVGVQRSLARIKAV